MLRVRADLLQAEAVWFLYVVLQATGADDRFPRHGKALRRKENKPHRNKCRI